jgi:hypothetical protein
MTLKAILEKCSVLDTAEMRHDSPEYAELVFYSRDTAKWSEILAEFLDMPAKPAGAKPEEGDLVLTEGYGGIYQNQTLFKKAFDAGAVIAMLWPWQDGEHTTLKLILLKR